MGRDRDNHKLGEEKSKGVLVVAVNGTNVFSSVSSSFFKVMKTI